MVIELGGEGYLETCVRWMDNFMNGTKNGLMDKWMDG